MYFCALTSAESLGGVRSSEYLQMLIYEKSYACLTFILYTVHKK